MGFDIKKIKEMQKQKQNDKKELKRLAKERKEQQDALYKQSQAIQKIVLNNWERWLTDTEEWQDNIQKTLELFNHDVKLTLVLENAKKTHEEYAPRPDDFNDNYDLDVVTCREIKTTTVRLKAKGLGNFDGLDCLIPINIDGVLTHPMCNELVDECATILAQQLRKYKLKAIVYNKKEFLNNWDSSRESTKDSEVTIYEYNVDMKIDI